jgi:hypothetical protein
MRCPACDAAVRYDTLDEAVCRCGWSEAREFEQDVRRRCETRGFVYRSLLRDLGDVETIDAFLWALSKDD